ncbi:MAG: response regulator [Pirellulaceae bacterium]
MVRNLNLLVVDDDPSIVRIVKTYLEKGLPADINLHTATSPEEAQTWLDEHCCDILISDIEMPGISGLDMLRFARHRNAWTQVVFLTGHSTWDRIAEAIENGASDYLLKPINRDELIDVVSQTRSRMIRWQQALKGTLHSAAQS